MNAGFTSTLPITRASLSFEARFLPEFADTGGDGGFVRVIHDPAGNLQLHGLGAVAELLDHHELLMRRDRDDVDPVANLDLEEIVFDTVARRALADVENLEEPEVGSFASFKHFPRSDHSPRSFAAQPCLMRSTRCFSASS